MMIMEPWITNITPMLHQDHVQEMKLHCKNRVSAELPNFAVWVVTAVHALVDVTRWGFALRVNTSRTWLVRKLGPTILQQPQRHVCGRCLRLKGVVFANWDMPLVCSDAAFDDRTHNLMSWILSNEHMTSNPWLLWSNTDTVSFASHRGSDNNVVTQRRAQPDCSIAASQLCTENSHLTMFMADYPALQCRHVPWQIEKSQFIASGHLNICTGKGINLALTNKVLTAASWIRQ